ncbi:hypothetical protein VTL71DRAFT_1738 [Oculimacula yallundae]|uniref:Zn(2)-C6 fungal-type domain-containing protein n=1 Tax=Oculimacula yallundae TaxID=86028 RepID=A0ABR4CBI7_9HELO
MPPSKETTTKRRSCDECRTRKLACTKDPDGCERCKRENIVCIYSEQKPMGRPRKRQHVESHIEQQIETQSIENLDLGIAFNFGYNDDLVAEPYFTNGQPAFDNVPDAVTPPKTMFEDGRSIWNFAGMATPAINFGDAFKDPVANQAPSSETVPLLSMNSNDSVTESDISSPPGPCGCLASMYLALAALQQLPSDIASALTAVRSAAGTASESIWCPQCGSVALDNPNPPMDAFQNTMLLGTILPIIANGYKNLLSMVDKETELATAAGKLKTFRFQDYGGMCGRIPVTSQAQACFQNSVFYEAVEMSPQEWRTTVRAMLRIDIYGHEQPEFKHKGLRDLVSEMEFRQKTRHEMLEAHARHATMNAESFQGRLCPGERVHTCLEVLKVAKFAIDQLVIA